MGDAAMRFLDDDSLAGRIMVCKGGEPSRLLPLVDWETALSGGCVSRAAVRYSPNTAMAETLTGCAPRGRGCAPRGPC